MYTWKVYNLILYTKIQNSEGNLLSAVVVCRPLQDGKAGSSTSSNYILNQICLVVLQHVCLLLLPLHLCLQKASCFL